LRRIALIASLDTCSDHASLKSGLALFFNDTVTKKAGLFIAADEMLPIAALCMHIKNRNEGARPEH
jgi:hypothetical protein